MLSPTDAFVTASLLCVAGLFWLRRDRKTCLPLPPGPPRHWLLGNARDFPTTDAWLKFRELAATYGPIMSFSLPGGNTVIFLNTREAISDLLEKKSALYSDRPVTVMSELMGFDDAIILRPDGPGLRRYRRMCRIALGPSAVPQYTPIQEKVISRFIETMKRHHAQSPNGDDFFMGQIRLSAVRAIVGIAYGIEIDDVDHPYIKLAEHAASFLARAIQPSRYLVNFIPILRYIPEWFPGAAFKREARLGNAAVKISGTAPFDEVVSEMDSGSAPPSFVSLLLTNIDDPNASESDKYDREAVIITARAMYNAGVETTNSTLNSFIAAMLQHPEMQARAQAELDSIVGTWQLPSLEDRDRLPYVHAIVKETMRWQPPIPFGLPHRITRQDDVYKGYYIPKGSTIIANIWNVARSGPAEERLDEFDPSRYLDPSRDTPDNTVIFGFGRRVCVGQLVAENMIFLMVGAILSSFTILPPLDQTGSETLEWHGLSSNQPLPFRCRLVPRQAKAD